MGHPPLLPALVPFTLSSMHVLSRAILGISLSLGLPVYLESQQPAKPKPVILSTVIPKDSLGETVYDLKGDADKDAAVVPGVLVVPKLVKDVKPSIPLSSRLHHRNLHILVQGVVSANGDVIDVTLVHEDADSALARNVVEAFGRCKFRPGMLDGRPVAVFVQKEYPYNMM